MTARFCLSRPVQIICQFDDPANITAPSRVFVSASIEDVDSVVPVVLDTVWDGVDLPTEADPLVTEKVFFADVWNSTAATSDGDVSPKREAVLAKLKQRYGIQSQAPAAAVNGKARGKKASKPQG